MKIWIICSKRFYNVIPDIQRQLIQAGHIVFLPNNYDNPTAEDKSWENNTHQLFKKSLFYLSKARIREVDAVLVLNLSTKNQKNYIGGTTFIDIYEAFMQKKKIYLYNDIPPGILYDEIHGFSPVVIHGDLEKIRDEVYQ